MKVAPPNGFSLWIHGRYCIVLRNDLHPSCRSLVSELAQRPDPRRGEIVLAPFPTVQGSKILVAFRRTVRGGALSRFGIGSTLGFTPRTLCELKIAATAERIGAPVAPPLGCYWKWDASGISYTGGYFSVYQEKALCLSEVLEGWTVARLSLFQRRQVLSQLARAMTQLHQTGIVHTDLTVRNVLFNRNRCLFIDLDGAYRVRAVSDWALVSTLSRLNRSLEKCGMGRLVSLRDRLWFLKEHLGSLHHNKMLVRRILAQAARDLRWHRFFWTR
jgi:Lipopolysaccharide kinase (Kdo/WaaP) family